MSQVTDIFLLSSRILPSITLTIIHRKLCADQSSSLNFKILPNNSEINLSILTSIQFFWAREGGRKHFK